MSDCSCGLTPCECSQRPCTYCDRDRKDNVWVEGVVDENGQGGICMLDTMTEDQIVNVLQRNDRARADLLRVTSDPCLLSLAQNVQRLPTTEPMDQLQSEVNRSKDSIPFYSVFQGRFPFAQ